MSAVIALVKLKRARQSKKTANCTAATNAPTNAQLINVFAAVPAPEGFPTKIFKNFEKNEAGKKHIQTCKSGFEGKRQSKNDFFGILHFPVYTFLVFS